MPIPAAKMVYAVPLRDDVCNESHAFAQMLAGVMSIGDGDVYDAFPVYKFAARIRCTVVTTQSSEDSVAVYAEYTINGNHPLSRNQMLATLVEMISRHVVLQVDRSHGDA